MPALVPLDSTYGAMLIGAMVSVWCVQWPANARPLNN